MIGKTISHYKILEKLGEGGMGVVYKAEDTKLERTVALKFLPAGAVGSEEDAVRFKEEARAAAALDHPNICTVYEINEVDGQQFIAMAFVEGESLKDKLDERPLKLTDALKYSIQIAKGLSAAHEKGIVHRDIKSSNIMVTPKGRVKIMDFGLAHRGEAARGLEESSTLGTVAYSSPEQASGEPMDHRTDIWSFGVTLYEMVTGQLPFRGDYEQAILYSILNEVPEPVTGLRTGVPIELERIIDKALAKKVDDRYQHVDDMLFDLKTLQNELDPTTSRTGPRTGTITGTRPVYAQESSLFRKFLDRHVFQVLIVYLAATWGATRLTSWLVDQFVLSPHLVNMVMLTFISLLPTVILLSFFRGARDSGRWTKPEKFGIPVNLVLSLSLLVLAFQGKDIGAATTTVAVENEEGVTIERVVPKSEFRKKVALYVFKNVSGDSTLDWMQYSIPLLLEYDLLQDQFLRVVSAFDRSSLNRLKNAGFNDWLDAPTALKRTLAKEYHLDYFALGTVNKVGGKYVIDFQLHSTRTDKLVAESTHENTDFFALIDEISVRLKEDMGVPAGYLEETADMAVSEMLTNSLEAARRFGLAQKALVFDQDWEASLEHYEAAIREDETQAYAHYNMYLVYTMLGQPDAADKAITAAMQHAYKLPERMQFIVKANYYFAKQQTDKSFALLKMMAELYPTDIMAHQGLVQMYTYRNELENAIAEGEKILELDPYHYEFMLTVADMYVRTGKNDKALTYFERYAELNPKEATSFTRLGGFYEQLGDYEKARANYEKALLIDPARVTVLIDLAEIERKLGRSDAALEQYNEALEKARSDEDRVAIHSSMVVFYRIRGQIEKALEQWILELEAAAQSQAPMARYLAKMDDVELYVLAGKPDRAFEIMDEIKSNVGPPFDKAIYLGYVSIYTELEKPEEAQEALDQFEEYIKAYNLEILRPLVTRMKGRIEELRGDYELAISAFEQQHSVAPSQLDAYRSMGRCYRKLGDYTKAKENLIKMLNVYPFDPETNYEFALVYDAAGDRAKALTHMERAVAVWSDADDGFKPAATARETLEQWKSQASNM